LVKYELALLDQDDEEISEVRTYHTAVKAPLTRYFMFLNSLGSFEVLRFVGQANRQTEFSREVVQKFLPHDYAAEDGEFAVNSVLSVKKNNFSSGYIKGKLAAEWHEYMEDFLLSPRIFNITTGSRIPVVITGASMELQDQNYERFIRFDAKPGYDNISFTPSSL
jgi:hypothetical protein